MDHSTTSSMKKDHSEKLNKMHKDLDYVAQRKSYSIGENEEIGR